MSRDNSRILIVDDEQQMRSAMQAVLGRLGYAVLSAKDGSEALNILEQSSPAMIISDMKMPVMDGERLLEKVTELYPDIPLVLITAYGTIEQAVTAMKRGAFDFITKPFSAEDIERVVNRVFSLGTSVAAKKARRGSQDKGTAIITADESVKRVLEIAATVAPSSASILVQGESGTGKELIARLIHTASGRSGNFVAVNCAALPENLLESELFGHEKGAFTGATTQKIGKFEQADGGTILLDEISEMELGLQAKLLRVLQENEVDRVGGTRPISVNVKVVATTNRDLRGWVSEGSFREDLYYRLNVVPLYVPPLRERGGDVKLLIDHFIRRFSDGKIGRVSDELHAQLMTYSWPGNIRELQNACQRAVLLAQNGKLNKELFLLGAFEPESPNEKDDSLVLHSGLSVAEAEKRLIFETLKATKNNKTKAAELLGISIRTLRNKLNEYAASAP